MDGTASPAPSSEATAAASPVTPATTEAPAVAAAPEWVPDALKADWGKPEYAEKATKAYADTHAKLSTRNDDFRKQVAADLAAERAKAKPATPEEYKFSITPGSDIETMFKQAGVNLVDNLPESGDPTTHMLNAESETMKVFRSWAHKHDIPQESFNDMVAHVVLRDVQKVQQIRAAQEELYAKQDAAELEKLGANGAARKEAATKGIQAHMVAVLGKEKGEEAGRVLALATCFAGGVEGLEAILGAVSGGLTPGGGSAASDPATFETMFPNTAKYYASKG
jgi:hypothetical protein